MILIFCIIITQENKLIILALMTTLLRRGVGYTKFARFLANYKTTFPMSIGGI